MNNNKGVLEEGKRKKVLFIVEAFGGGLFSYIVELANQIIEHVDVCIVYAVRKQTPKNFKEYFHKDIKFIEVENFTREINLIKDIKASIELSQIVKNEKPDVIHLHSSKAGVLGRIIFRNKQYKLFYTPHGYSFLMKNCNIVKRMLYKTIEWLCGKMSTCTTIACSYGEYQASKGISRNATYVSNGINVESMVKLLKKFETTESKQFTVCTLGRICFQKDPVLFNKVAELLPNIKFLWIGDGELRNELTSSNIEITGWCEREVALQHVYNADAFMLTSRWEGLPYALLESMFLKKVCIVSDVIGNHDVIKNKENGFICDSAREFASRIEKVQKRQYKEVIARAYQNIIDEYNTLVMADSYMKIYTNNYINKEAVLTEKEAV